MSLLNDELNNKTKWEILKKKAMHRIEVDLNEVERVIEMARRTPGLSSYDLCFKQLSIFFATATKYYREKYPEGLTGLIDFWEKYRSAVIQRYTALTPVELRAADKVVANVFDRFIQKIPPKNIAYFENAKPLVYGGEGGLYGYYTHPPGWNRPFAIINLPHAAFDNVWHWLALPHETGHDLYATVSGLDKELENTIAQRMRQAVQNGEINIPDIDIDLSAHGLPKIQYSGKDFIALIWKGWANEAQADLAGILSCGGAAILALQQIVGFSTDDIWLIDFDEQGKLTNYPEPHPTSYIRNVFNISVLRLIDKGNHMAFANEINQRFNALKPDSSEIVWRLSKSIEFARIDIKEMEKSAKIAAETFCNHRLNALGNKSYSEVTTFTSDDQEKVNEMVTPLLNGDSTFTQVKENIEARHALAATAIAFEKDIERAEIINRTFQHFI